jgi:hypothetical protein
VHQELGLWGFKLQGHSRQIKHTGAAGKSGTPGAAGNQAHRHSRQIRHNGYSRQSRRTRQQAKDQRWVKKLGKSESSESEKQAEKKG